MLFQFLKPDKKTDKMKIKNIAFLTALVLVMLTGALPSTCTPKDNGTPTLKEAFKDDFLVGVAVNGRQIMGKDSLSTVLIEQQFSSLTAENCMKWEKIHPRPGEYDFELADRLVEYARENGMHVYGHVLIWHSQVPRWVFQDSEGNLTTRDTLLARMKDHISTVVGRYRGKVDSWEVLNEAVGDDGKLRETLWYRIIGEDYIEKAFEFAREADPDAQLIYNDYSLPNQAKRDGVVALVKDLQSKGVKIDGIGMQAHYQLDYPSIEDLEASIEAFGDLGVKVMITEMDVDVLPSPRSYRGADVGTRFEMQQKMNPYTEGLPPEMQDSLAQRYSEFFTVFHRHRDVIDRVTFWGVHDGLSWKNNWPVRGRTNYPLLFDREGKPKPAFDAVIRVVSTK
jgi:endo-1,4-beta-xylanase